MCDNDNSQNVNTGCECLNDILQTIIMLQNQDFECDDFGGCDKPYLGPTPNVVCYNTRPINLYNCTTGTLWTFPYTLNGTSGTSSVFRVESIDECCCTCRVLAPNTDTTNTENPYEATNDFFTINLNCVSAVKCLNDTYVELC